MAIRPSYLLPPARDCAHTWAHARLLARMRAGTRERVSAVPVESHTEKRRGEAYVTPEISEMTDEVMKKHR